MLEILEKKKKETSSKEEKRNGNNYRASWNDLMQE